VRARRAGLAAGAAVGAFALGPTAAQAANFEVNTLSDAPADGCTTDPNGCTLRDAITAAGANTEADVITFQSGLTGTVTLTQGQLQTANTVVDDITIQGPGAGAITISGDADGNGHDTGDSRILYVSAPNTGFTGTSVAISGLTLSGGYPTSGGIIGGGAIYLGKYTHLSLDDTTVTGNATMGGGTGGAIASEFPKYTEISITDSTISGNTAGGGGGISTSGPLTVDNSTLSDNHAPGGGGGAISFGQKYGPLLITDSTISANTAYSGGGISSGPFSGGPSSYSAQDSKITNTTISGNSATSSGGGIASFGLYSDQGSFTIDHSTVSGNHATNTTSYGGGIDVAQTVNGSFQVVDSTISGNDAGVGGGISVRSQVGPNGSVSADNSTVAANTVTYEGGGMWAFSYGSSPGPYPSPPVQLNSTIVGDNTAGLSPSPNDLGRADQATSGGFQLTFSLVEAPTDAVDTQANSITGADPQLGGLAGNGGPTQTQLPAGGSPAIDAGQNPLALSTDQRGLPRTVDLGPGNASDGTDIGAVEVGAPPSPSPVPPPKKKAKCKKKKKHKKRSAESSKKKHKKCKKKHKKKRR
jgi:CSLREA domain-containing protein